MELICHNRVSYLLPKQESRRFLPHLLKGVMDWKGVCHKGFLPLLQGEGVWKVFVTGEINICY